MKKILFVVFIFSVLSCEKKDITPPNNNGVSVETISAELISNGGVILKGRIKDVQIPLNYGFVFSTYEGGTYEYAEISEYLSGTFNGEYNITFRNNLYKEQTYYYNAVAYTSNEFIFGEEKTFISNGSTIPSITSVEPVQAHLFDTISIKGKHFSKTPNVFFNERKADLIFKSDTLITCAVPFYNYNQEDDASPVIKIVKPTKEEASFDQFSLYKPEVLSMEPYLVHDTDTVTIHGNHFHKDPLRNRLTMEVNGSYYSVEIIESSRTEIKFINSGIYYAFHPKFKLRSQFQTIDITDKLELKMPTITELPECMSFDEDIVIKGTNFPSAILNDFLTINIGGTRFTPKKVYKDSLVMQVYDTYYKDFHLKDVVLNYFGNETVYPADICINEPWIIVGNVRLSRIHSYQNETYGIIYEGHQQPGEIGKFDVDQNKFESLTGEFIPAEVRYGPKIFNKSKMYHYSTSPNNPNAFKSYDIFTKQLEDLAPFPGELRTDGLINTIGDYIYFGLGANVVNQHYADIWRYSIPNDSWEFVIDFPGIDSKEDAKEKPLNFVIGNNIYIAAGQRNYAHSDFWVLNTNTGTIESKEPLPSPIASSWIYDTVNATSFLNKGYYFNQFLEEYDPDTDSWKTYFDIPGGSPEYGIFFHNGFLYKTSTNKIQKLNPLYLK